MAALTNRRGRESSGVFEFSQIRSQGKNPSCAQLKIGSVAPKSVHDNVRFVCVGLQRPLRGGRRKLLPRSEPAQLGPGSAKEVTGCGQRFAILSA